MGTKNLQKEDSAAGAVSAAQDIVSQLQEQAKNGQIDGALLDQLNAILKVSVDAAEDQQSVMESAAGQVEDVNSAPQPEPSVPDESEAEQPEPPELNKEGDAELPEETEEELPETDEEESMVNKLQNGEPVSSRPGTPSLIFDKVEDYRRVLPDFIKSMENGRVRQAQKIAGDNASGFDTLFNMAQRALLNEGGWNASNLAKINASATEDVLRKLNDNNAGNALKKSITASSVPGYYLIRLAKLMLPVYAGLTRRLPTDSPKVGAESATWKAQLGFGSLSESAFFRIAEGSIGVEPPTSFLTFQAPYNDLSVNDNVTLKAIRASAGYSDPLQIGVIKAMSALLRGQERVNLGSSRAAIDAPAAPTIAQGTPAQTVIAAGSYVLGVSALTYEGWLAQSVGGSAAVGETVATYSSQFVLGSGSSIVATWAAIPGAVAYNVYLSGSSGHYSGSSATYHSTVLINKATISTLPTGGLDASADTTVNATYGVEGLIAWCEKETVYGNAIPNKQKIYDNAGAGLTAGNGGITQFDHVLADLWTVWNTAPSLMVMSPNMNSTLVGKLQSLGSGNFYRVDVTNERNTVNGGLMVTGYVNKFAPYADGTPRMMDVIPHPYMPDGKVLFLSETIPYPMGNESRGFVRDILLPYTYFPLPSQAAGVNKIRYDFSIATSETIECFNPGPQSAITGIDYTL